MSWGNASHKELCDLFLADWSCPTWVCYKMMGVSACVHRIIVSRLIGRDLPPACFILFFLFVFFEVLHVLRAGLFMSFCLTWLSTHQCLLHPGNVFCSAVLCGPVLSLPELIVTSLDNFLRTLLALQQERGSTVPHRAGGAQGASRRWL